MISFLLRCSHPTPHFPSLALLTWITFYNRVFPSQPTLPFTCSAHSGHLWSPSASGVPIPPHTSLHLLCSLRSPLISSGVPIPTHISLHLLCSLGSPLISLGVHIPPHTSLHLLCSLGSPFIISVPSPPYASLHLLCSLRSPLISFLLRCSHPTPHFPSPALLSAPIPPHTFLHLLCSLRLPLISSGIPIPPYTFSHLLCSLGSPLISFLLRCSHPTPHFPSPALLTRITFDLLPPQVFPSHPTRFPSPALLTRITFDLLAPQVLPSHVPSGPRTAARWTRPTWTRRPFSSAPRFAFPGRSAATPATMSWRCQMRLAWTKCPSKLPSWVSWCAQLVLPVLLCGVGFCAKFCCCCCCYLLFVDVLSFRCVVSSTAEFHLNENMGGRHEWWRNVYMVIMYKRFHSLRVHKNREASLLTEALLNIYVTSNSNWKTLYYKDCSLGSVKNLSNN